MHTKMYVYVHLYLYIHIHHHAVSEKRGTARFRNSLHRRGKHEAQNVFTLSTKQTLCRHFVGILLYLLIGYPNNIIGPTRENCERVEFHMKSNREVNVQKVSGLPTETYVGKLLSK